MAKTSKTTLTVVPEQMTTDQLYTELTEKKSRKKPEFYTLSSNQKKSMEDALSYHLLRLDDELKQMPENSIAYTITKLLLDETRDTWDRSRKASLVRLSFT